MTRWPPARPRRPTTPPPPPPLLFFCIRCRRSQQRHEWRVLYKSGYPNVYWSAIDFLPPSFSCLLALGSYCVPHPNQPQTLAVYPGGIAWDCMKRRSLSRLLPACTGQKRKLLFSTTNNFAGDPLAATSRFGCGINVHAQLRQEDEKNEREEEEIIFRRVRRTAIGPLYTKSAGRVKGAGHGQECRRKSSGLELLAIVFSRQTSYVSCVCVCARALPAVIYRNSWLFSAPVCLPMGE